MDRAAAVTNIQNILGFRTDSEALIITKLQEVQKELETSPELPHFLRSEVEDLVTVANTQTVDISAINPAFLREWDDDALYYYNADAANEDDIYTPLRKTTMKKLRYNFPGSGVPKAYARVDKLLYIGPTPDDVYTLKWIYYGADALLTTNIENKWLEYLPYLLIGKVGYLMASSLRDANAMKIFAQLEAGGMQKLVAQTADSDGADIRPVMGGDD